MGNQVYKTELTNGLTVVLKEMHHVPVASFWVWYRVGSRCEHDGITGAAHWVEHMMFKGTPNFPPGKLDRMISREGGQWNAFTWVDYTAYYETLPSNKIELALQLESDRMTNTIMTESETDSERTVIISERQMNENRPMFHLYEEIMASAFRVHPYHHVVIGDEIDLKTMSRDDLYGFYQQYYAPNNATVVVVGDFETTSMMTMIENYFGRIEPRSLPTTPVRPEPPQRGERQTTVKGPGQTAYLIYAYKSPSVDNPDYFPMVLLNAAFSGGESLGMFSSGTTNKSSRLYKALVSAEIAVSVSGNITPTIDPYIYNIVAIAHPEHTLAEIETALDAEIERLESEPINSAELEKARKRAQVELVHASESITGQAQMLGMAEALTRDYRWFETAIEQLNAVTLADIERVRKTYLNHDNRTVGRYLPQEIVQSEKEI